MSERIARTLALGSNEGMLAREIAAALRMTESPEYAAVKVRSALRCSAAFVEISRGRWQRGCRATSEPLPLPDDEYQEWMRRAFGYLLRQVAARAGLKNEMTRPPLPTQRGDRL
ncbi:hypothetical protein MED01_003106 [Micromonospora sp. MED01]|uniref:hypothetical protein n=1 Tax=Micromonospora alfalfae TaxID=2911212 RepID=UPI001EE96F2B|nr:hypothetical protein [Micromonospora alfalfae]MCG5464849.1 hypothetical protein [Micromonospora alfalfae]